MCIIQYICIGEIKGGNFLECDNINKKLLDTEFELKPEYGRISIYDRHSGELPSPFAVCPVSINKYHGSNNKTVTYITSYYNENELPPIEVCGRFDKNTINKMYKVWGSKVVPELSNIAINAIISFYYALCQFVDEKSIYTLPAWSTDASYYMLGNLKITNDNIEPVKTSYQCRTITELNCDKSYVHTFIKESLLTLSDDVEYPLTLILFTFLGIMLPLLQENHLSVPSFVLLIIGSTNTFKTSSVTAVCNSTEMLTASFEDTASVIKSKLKEPNNGICIVDDLNFNSKDKVSKLEDIIRLIGDKSTSGSKLIRGKIDDSEVKNMCIVTGESQPKLRSSSIPRVLIYDIDKNTVNKKALTEIQNHSDVMTMVIAYIAQYCMRDNIAIQINDEVRHMRQILNEKELSVLPQYLDIAVWMTVAWENVNKIFLGTFSNIDYSEMIISRIKKLEERFKNDPVSLFLKTISILIEQNELTASIDEDGLYENTEIIIYQYDIFVVSGKVYNKVVQYCEKTLNLDFPCSEKKLRNLLFSQEILKAVCSEKLTHQLRKKNFSKSGFYLYKSKIGGIL